MALKRFRAAPLPQPPRDYDPQYVRQLIRVIELYFNQLDSKTPNFAESYEADTFVGGEFREGVAAATSSQLFPRFSSVMLADASGGAVVIDLPPSSQSKGRRLAVKKTDGTANTVTVQPAPGELIDGATSLILSTAFASTTLVSDGTNWWVL